MILMTLEEVIKNGMTHSFFLIYQLCPNILDDDFVKTISVFKGISNIVNWIESDVSAEILDIMINK